LKPTTKFYSTALLTAAVLSSSCTTVPYKPTYAAAPNYMAYMPELGESTKLDDNYTYGFLTVPENRRSPTGRQIRIAVARVKAVSKSPKPDPIVYLAGGPGGIGILEAKSAVASGINADRDVIFVDQRGCYHSEPRLTCPEYDRFFDDSLQLHFSASSTAKLQESALRTCRDRFIKAGTDIASYNTSENAADIADLRVALGIKEWNVYGTSYGTDLAQWLLRDHPEGIRSVVLDAVVPVSQNLVKEWWPGVAGGYKAMFDECAAQPACKAAYPNLEMEFVAVVTRLSQKPMVVNNINIDGYQFANLIVQQSYVGEQGFAAVPKMIHEMFKGNGKLAADALLARSSPPGLVGYGLALGAYCREMASWTNAEEVKQDAKKALPAFPDDVLKLVPVSGRIFDDCAVWNAGSANGAERAPAISNIPVLVMNGTFDAVTPPVWGHKVASTLKHSQTVDFPGLGHGVMLKSSCAQSIMTAFINNPLPPVDSTCAQEMALPTFQVQ